MSARRKAALAAMEPKPEMTIRAIAPWFGGKRTMAADIVELLGPHTQYFEPFCGSMAVLFAKDPSQKETVNDLHGDLTNLAFVLADYVTAVRLYERLGSTLMSDGILEEAQSRLARAVEFPPIGSGPKLMATAEMAERAYWYFVASWMGRNGTAGTSRVDYQLAVRWTKNGGSPTQRFRNAVGSIPAWHERLQNVVIIRRDAFEIIPRFEDCDGTAIYADPPYATETRGGRDQIPGGDAKYLHEFSHSSGGLFGSRDDHALLAEQLRAFKHARVVVSAYDCPRYRDLYDGWEFIDKTRQKNLYLQNGRGVRPKDAPEVLIVNRRFS